MDQQAPMQSGNMDWLRALIGGQGLGAAGAGLAGLFNAGDNPSQSAQPYLNQIPGQSQQYYSPYMEAGKGALSSLQNQYGDLLSGNKQNQLGESFKESPGYKWKLDQALKAGHYAAQGGGFAGTPQDQQYAMSTATGLADKEYNNYLQNQMGLYGQGLQGQQGLNQMGYNANTGYADILNNNSLNQANNAYSGQYGQNQARSQGLGSLFSGLGQAASMFFL